MQQSWNILPEKFLERLTNIIPADKKIDVLESFCFRHPSTFRANTLKISPDELQRKLLELGIETEKVSWFNDAFILKNVPQRVLSETEYYKNGFLYIQSLSSMIPPLVLDPKPNEKILDITAAPGSKTTQIAALMNNTGELVANDVSRVRLYKLEANLKMQGVTNAKILNKHAEMIWKLYPEHFDKTLVDVPCSMEGRFYTEDEKTYREWSPRKIEELEKRQKFILRSAISATKPNGIIVYSTCTLSPEENEGVIDWILKKEQGNVVLEDIAVINLELIDGLTKWKNKMYNSEIAKTKRILPSKAMEGFFIAKIRKISPTIII